MSCNSCSSITLPVGATGASGLNGSDGSDGTPGSNGLFGGYSLEFDFDSSLVANPPAGEIRFNNATPASVTEIYISTTGTGSIDTTAFLDSFDDNADPGNHGFIRIFKEDSSSVFWMGKVTAVTTPGSYKTLAVTHISSGGTLADTNDVVVSFVANGSNGATKSGAIYNYSILDDGDNKSGTSFQLMNTFNIPANTFETNMDEISLKGGFSGFNTPKANAGLYVFKVEIDGQDVMDTLFGFNEGTMVAPYATPGVGFEMKFYRTASNKLRPVILYKNIYFGQGVEGNNISTSDVWAGNLYPYIGDQYFTNLANLSFPEITCPTAFTSALTVNIYMKATTPSLEGRLEAPAFRVMNLHSSYNKI